MNKNKFSIGDKVRFIGDIETDVGEVVGMSFDGSEWVYKITAKEVDLAKKEILNGTKTCKEEELVAVPDVKEEE